MKKILSVILAFLCLASPLSSYGAFDSAVESAKEKDTDSNESEKSHGSSASSSQSDSAESSLAQFFAEIFAYLWLFNIYARYCPYPYSDDSTKYLVYADFGSDSNDTEIPPDVETFPVPERTRKHRFSLDTSAVWLKELGIGNETRFDSMLFPVVGLYAKNFILYDHIHNEGSMGNVNLGINFPLFQTNPLSLSVKIGWARWYNDVTQILKDGAFVLGAEWKSYPFKPLTLRWDIDWQIFPDSDGDVSDVYVFNSDVQMGIMIERFEVFAGWKYMSTGTGNSDSAHWHGVNTGIRMHF